MPASVQHSPHKIVSKIHISPYGKLVHVAGDSLVVQKPFPTSFFTSSVNQWQVSLLILFYKVSLLSDNEPNLAGHNFGQRERGLRNIFDKLCLKQHI